MAELRERRRTGRFREESMSFFAVFVDEGLCSASEARRARWSAHRAEYGSLYLILSSVILASFAYRLVEPLPPEAQSVTVPFVMGPSLLLVAYVFAGAWGARFAGSRIHRQVAKLLDELGDVDELASGVSFRCRLGNPARLEQRSSADSWRPFPSRSWKPTRTRAWSARSARYRRLARLEPAPLKTWTWQLSSLSVPVLLSIIALPVAGFLIVKFAGSSTPTGLAVAAVATAFQAAVRYVKNHRD